MRHRRWLIGGGVLTFFLFWGLFIGARVTDRPNFCGSCHLMAPYYDNWAGSSHVRVRCIDCHYGRGFGGYLAGKMRLIGEVLRYTAGAYNPQVHAKVEDEACLRCHSEKALEEGTPFLGKIPFSHRDHYRNPSRTLELVCTSCHSELVQGSHLAVTKEACILCHFGGLARGEPLGGCEACHGPPKDAIVIGEIRFNHSDYLRSGVTCESCHLHVTRGTGDVPREKCYSCHVERFEAYGQTRRLHAVHVTDQKIACGKCHSELEHGKFEMAEAFSPNCQSCHGGRHSIQEEVYIGLGGSGVEDVPDPMFLSGVSCAGCHEVRVERKNAGRTVVFAEADEAACVRCHGEGYDRLMRMWQAQVKRRLRALEGELERLNRDLRRAEEEGEGGEAVSRARALYRQVQGNVALIIQDGSAGVHNIRYTHRLLQEGENAVRRARALLGDGGLPREPEPLGLYTSPLGCTRCHVGIESARQTVQGPGPHEERFSHGWHLWTVGLDCDACHDPQRHGTTQPGAADCTACHPGPAQLAKASAQDCLMCHTAQVPSPADEIRFSHQGHIGYGIRCDACHAGARQLDHLTFVRQQREQTPAERFSHALCAACHTPDLTSSEGTGCLKCHTGF